MEVAESKRTQVESSLEQARQFEDEALKSLEALEQELSRREQIENQLAQQIQQLENSLQKSQYQEHQAQERARTVTQQLDKLAQEAERLKEDLGPHPLNQFESKIYNLLQNRPISSHVVCQFDTATRGTSKFTDFLVSLNHCVVLIEAKSYSGLIKSSNPRNAAWYCQKEREEILINACWGDNPYHQIKACGDAFRRQHRAFQGSQRMPTYGVVVFPGDAQISEEISDCIGGYYRVVTLFNLNRTLQELDNQAKDHNRSGLTGRQVMAQILGETSSAHAA